MQKTSSIKPFAMEATPTPLPSPAPLSSCAPLTTTVATTTIVTAPILQQTVIPKYTDANCTILNPGYVNWLSSQLEARRTAQCQERKKVEMQEKLDTLPKKIMLLESDIKLLLTRDPSNPGLPKLQLHLLNAQQRLAEAQQYLKKGDFEAKK